MQDHTFFLREAIKKSLNIKEIFLGGQFENQIFFKLKFLPGGRGSESKCRYFFQILSGFLKGFFKGNHPLIFPKNVWHLKTMRKVFI